MTTPLGSLLLKASPKGLQSLSFTPAKVRASQSPPVQDSHFDALMQAHLDLAEKELTEYFEGRRTRFSVSLDLQIGTEFQREVWQALREIPFARTKSYRELAEAVKRPKATRAVGSANGRNPIPIIIPCHRVIAADGGIGGYTGGLTRKRKLLAIEHVHIKE